MRNIFGGLLILSPIFMLLYLVYNPAERDLIKRDTENKNTINVLSRALETHFKKNGVYPQSLDLLETLPYDIHQYGYTVSKDGGSIVIFSKAHSLAWREYCLEGESYITYSSVDERTAIVCSPPTPGPQKFVN